MRASLVLVAVGVLAACGDDAVTPSRETLSGWWLHQSADGTQTIFGFLAADELASIDLEGNAPPPGKDVSVVYQALSPYYVPVLVQVATYEVVDGALRQTVVADIAAPPGTAYSTKIVSLADASLELQSAIDPSGARTYTRTPRCLSVTHTGWSVAYVHDQDGGAAANVLMFDDDGTLHGINPGHQVRGAACQTPAVELPGAHMSTTGALRGDEMHVLLERPDGTVEHAWRVLPSGAWESGGRVAEVVPSGQPAYQMRLLVDGDDLVAVIARADATAQVVRRTGTTWTQVPVAFPAQGARIEDAVLAPDGSIVALTMPAIWRIAGTTVTATAMPTPVDNAMELTGSIVVDDRNRVHAAYSREPLSNGGMVFGGKGVYAILDGTSWTVHDFGPAMYPRVLPPTADTLRVVHGTSKASAPQMALTTLALDGTVRASESLYFERGFGTSPTAYRNYTAVASPDGTIAVTMWPLDSYLTLFRTPTPVVPRKMIDVRLTINGPGRGYTDDGIVDCSASCNVQVPWGTRLPIKLEPAAGHLGGASACPQVLFDEYGFCWHDTAHDLHLLGTAEFTFRFFPQ